ncbi:MAG TPA: DUF4097 family beta strand repeat-containing protein [Solirubrobacteraceae bacterium]|nr:DUF4097 family beta strand repeat-containing protein [Solirubrobacteraceae bacterium]
MTIATTAQPPPDPSRTKRRRHRALTIVGVLTTSSLVAFGALNLLDLAASHSFIIRARYAGITALVIDSGSGSVRLARAPAGSQLSVTERVDEGLSKPRREALRSAGGVLRLKTRCGQLPHCGVSYDIAVPKGVAVNARSAAGTVTADGLTTGRSLHLHSGASNVTARRISAPIVDVSSDSGTVSAQLTNPAQTLSASSGEGDVRLRVPNISYAVNARAPAGTVSDHSLRTDPRATHTITATSAAGNVTITLNRGG